MFVAYSDSGPRVKVTNLTNKPTVYSST